MDTGDWRLTDEIQQQQAPSRLTTRSFDRALKQGNSWLVDGTGTIGTALIRHHRPRQKVAIEQKAGRFERSSQ